MTTTIRRGWSAAAGVLATGGLTLGMTLGMAAPGGADGVGDAPVAPGHTNVTDQFIPYDAPGAFDPGPENIVISPTFGTTTPIACVVDQGAWRNCYQEGFDNEPHQMHYVANINGHGTWLTADLPEGSSVPEPPTVELPAQSVAQSIGDSLTGSAGASASPGAGLNLDITSSLGDIGVGLGTGSAG